MQIERLTPHLGARVTGLDLARVGDGDGPELRALIEQHLVVFFAGQDLAPADFLRFGRALGELEPPNLAAPFVPTLKGELSPVNYLEIDERVPRGTYSDQWHSDGSYFECPTYLAVLRPEILPTLGGDTLWASTYAAYDALSDSVRRSLDDLRAVHNAGRMGESTHPVVRVNPATGRRGLFVNRLFTKRIVGLGETESGNLLEMLFVHLASPEYQMRLRWTPDIVAVWDNRFSMHFAVRDYAERRRMLRLSLAGEKPIGPSEYQAGPASAAFAA